MTLQLAVDVLVIELSQVVREPFVPDCHEAEERTFTCALTADQAEHILELAPRLKYPLDCAHHEQLERLIGIVALVASEKMMQRVPNSLFAVPFQVVQIILNRVVTVLARYDVEGF